MTTPQTVKILISLPITHQHFLEALKRLDGATVSGYIRKLLEADLRARIESGWNPVTGWKHIDDPGYQRQMRKLEERLAAEKQVNEQLDNLFITRGRQILARKAATPTYRRPARPKKGGTP